MTTPIEYTHLRGLQKVTVQLVWLVLVFLLLAIFIIAIPVRWNHLLGNATGQNLSVYGLPVSVEAGLTSRPGPQELDAMAALGISPAFYATYILMFEVGLAVVCASIAFLIFWRKPNDWMALFFALILILLGTNAAALVVPTLSTVWTGWALVSTFFAFLGMTTNLLILFLAPDGRFVPRWGGIVCAGFVGVMSAATVYLIHLFGSWGALAGTLVFFLVAPLWVCLILIGIASQVYRYRWVSGPVQRQQTKWVVVGLAAITVGFALNALLLNMAGAQAGFPRLVYNMIRAPLVQVCMMLLPICIAISILRYRLWDIDILIRKTVTYALVVALLSIVYFSCVILLQQVFSRLTGLGGNEIITVLSTLAIAALFVPLRNRIQDAIDRRFYRKKYDAQQVLEKFAETVRDETDIDKLTAELVNVVQETMQPKSVSLWLKKENSKESR